ncbi:MAG: translation initiation factor IF-1 [Bacteroidota bacterium]
MSEFKIKTVGIVKEILSNGTYMIELKEEGEIIHATISSKARDRLSYDIMLGEEVPVIRSPYELTRGRIDTNRWERPTVKNRD